MADPRSEDFGCKLNAWLSKEYFALLINCMIDFGLKSNCTRSF